MIKIKNDEKIKIVICNRVKTNSYYCMRKLITFNIYLTSVFMMPVFGY